MPKYEHGINTVVMSGTVAFEPKVSVSASGTNWGGFKLRVVEKINGRDWSSTWSIKAFGRTVESISELHAGDYVMVQGRLANVKYKNKDGVDVEGVEITANYIASVMRAGGIGDTDATSFPPDDGTAY